MHTYKYKNVTLETITAGYQLFFQANIEFSNTIISFHSFKQTLSSFEIAFCNEIYK